MVFKCAYNFIIMLVTLVGIIAMHALVLIRSRKDSSILTSSIASIYCLYLQWSALSSETDESCNHNSGIKSNVWMQIVFGLVFTILALFVISGSTKTSDETNLASEISSHIVEKEENLEDRPEDEQGLKKSLREQKHSHSASINSEEAHVFSISTATIFF